MDKPTFCTHHIITELRRDALAKALLHQVPEWVGSLLVARNLISSESFSDCDAEGVGLIKSHFQNFHTTLWISDAITSRKCSGGTEYLIEGFDRFLLTLQHLCESAIATSRKSNMDDFHNAQPLDPGSASCQTVTQTRARATKGDSLKTIADIIASGSVPGLSSLQSVPCLRRLPTFITKSTSHRSINSSSPRAGEISRNQDSSNVNLNLHTGIQVNWSYRSSKTANGSSG